LKVLFKVEGGKEKHKHNFALIENYIQTNYGYKIDASGKDVSRLCFLSWDAELYLFEESRPINELQEVTAAPTKEEKKLSQIDVGKEKKFTELPENLDEIKRFTENKIKYEPNSRNKFIYLFACNCCRKGIEKIVCTGYMQANFTDRTTQELQQSIDNAYNHNLSAFGKYSKRSHKANNNIPNPTRGNNISGQNGSQKSDNGKSDFIPFWSEYEEVNQKTGKVTVKIAIIYREFRRFLNENGFWRLKKDKGYDFVRYKDKVCEIIEVDDIKNFVYEFLESNGFYSVSEMFSRGAKKYFSADSINPLPYVDLKFKKDSGEEAFFYFTNCWVRVTKDEIKTHPYTELDGIIWKTNIVNHHFILSPTPFDKANPLDFSKGSCEFDQFVRHVSHNDKSTHVNDVGCTPADILDRYFSFVSSIGFLLHGYKHPAVRKGIFIIDHKIGEKGEQNGRSGKSLIIVACSYLKRTATINGKSFDPKYQFKFELIKKDSQIVLFNDMLRNFDTETIFEIIADNYNANQRNNGYIHFKYSESPKVALTTNFLPKGEGESYSGRMHIIEASDYFHSGHSPYEEYGHSMFDDWNTEEYNRFYNFLLESVQYYLTNGLTKYSRSNFDNRKLIDECPQEFLDWMEMIDENTEKSMVEKNIPHRRKDLFDKYNAYHTGYYSNKVSPKKFGVMIKLYCETHGLLYNPHKEGGYDKRNGVEFMTVGDERFDLTVYNKRHNQTPELPMKAPEPIKTDLFTKNEQ
jgi:hypothetical protein